MPCHQNDYLRIRRVFNTLPFSYPLIINQPLLAYSGIHHPRFKGKNLYQMLVLVPGKQLNSIPLLKLLYIIMIIKYVNWFRILISLISLNLTKQKMDNI